MMKRIVGRLPLDYRLLFSGYLPAYVYRVGGLDRRYSLEQLRERGHITERARQSDRSATFSADIRRGVPESIRPDTLPMPARIWTFPRGDADSAVTDEQRVGSGSGSGVLPSCTIPSTLICFGCYGFVRSIVYPILAWGKSTLSYG